MENTRFEFIHTFYAAHLRRNCNPRPSAVATLCRRSAAENNTTA